jgi:hypothetical protein
MPVCPVKSSKIKFAMISMNLHQMAGTNLLDYTYVTIHNMDLHRSENFKLRINCIIMLNNQ